MCVQCFSDVCNSRAFKLNQLAVKSLILCSLLEDPPKKRLPAHIALGLPQRFVANNTTSFVDHNSH